MTQVDWRELALALTLADGKIDDDEVRILKRALWADGKIDKEEVNFLIELRNKAQVKAKAKKVAVNPKFMTLFFTAIRENVLQDGKIDANEANWLAKMLFADGRIDDDEKKFLARLKKEATKTSPEFETLYAKCMKSKK